MTIILLDPKDKPRQVEGIAAPRPATLEGKVLGVIDNTKHNSRYILEQVAELLKSKYALKEVIYETKHSASLPILQQQAEQLAAKSDIVIAGVGD